MSVSPQSNRTACSTARYATRALVRRILWALLALAPVTILIDALTHADKVLLFVLSCAALIPLALVLLGLYLTVTFRNLRRHRQAQREAPAEGAWTLSRSLVALAIATGLTAVVSEILVHSLDAFAKAVGASEFFIAAVIVAIVGNAAEHGGAIVIAHAGKMKLASEIAISSSAQVALLVTPAVMLLSLLFSDHLPLTFRWEEAVAMAGAVVLTVAMVWNGRSNRREGAALLVAYAGVVAGFLVAGNR